MSLINWIDKKIEDVKEKELFNDFFLGIEISEVDNDRYLFNPDKGIDIVMSEKMIIHSIHLFSGNTPESKKFVRESINNINFEMSQLEIESFLGKANKKGGGYKDIFGDIPCWGKYYFGTYSLHLQYSLFTSKIDIITIGSLKLEPYLNSILQ